MGYSYSLKRNKEFRYTYRAGKSLGGRSIAMVYAKSRVPKARIGFSVSKKIGNSVTRNRCKRRMREALYPLLPSIRPGCNIIFIAREPVKDEPFLAIRSQMQAMLKKAGLYAEATL